MKNIALAILAVGLLYNARHETGELERSVVSWIAVIAAIATFIV